MVDEFTGIFGFIDTNKKVIIDFMYENAHNFSEGLAGVANKEEKYGFVDEKNNLAIPCKYEFAYDFEDGIAKVNVKNEILLINKNADILFKNKKDPNRYGEQPLSYHNGFVRDLKKDKIGFCDIKGNVIIDYQFNDALHFSEDLAAVCVNKKWGYIDKKGNWVISPQFTQAYSFNEGLAMVKAKVKIKNETPKERIGFVNKNGDWVVEPLFSKFETINGFENGLAYVMQDKRHTYINKEGKIIWQGNAGD